MLQPRSLTGNRSDPGGAADGTSRAPCASVSSDAGVATTRRYAARKSAAATGDMRQRSSWLEPSHDVTCLFDAPQLWACG